MKKAHGNTGKRNAAKDSPKTAQIAFRVDADVKSELEHKANAHGLTLSAYLCRLVTRDSKRA